MINIDINKALVVGLGYRTGLAVANFLCDKGVDTTVSDMKSEDELSDIVSKLKPGIKVLSSGQAPEILDAGFDVIILSPGVPKKIPLIAEAYKRGIPVISEIELSYRYMKGSIIAITGTDGKSTTTTLVGHILKSLGILTFVGGNIGIPLISLVESTTDISVTVIELSSFQLETIVTFKPHAASILNVTPDHLDRYEGMEDYTDAKFRITANQNKEDYFIYNMDDEILKSGLNRVAANILSFSLSNDSSDIYYKDGAVYLKDGSDDIKVLEPEKMRILGIHNIQNAMASILMVKSIMNKMEIQIDYKKIEDAVYTFPGLEHRMEKIGKFKGRLFINDSKATTIGAVEMAVKSIENNGILILGGKTKGDDYTRLRKSINGKIKSLILIGESKDYMADIFSDYNISKVNTLDDAVTEAMKKSGDGDTILFSPACASFDMFKNYEERGRVFKESYSKLTKGELSWT